MKLVTIPQMRSIEQEADGSGLSYEKMMENAGYNLSREVLKLAYAQDDEEEIQVIGLVGPGNNGGDTLMALTRLAEKGWTARAYLIHRKPGNDPLVKRLEEADGEVYLAEKDADSQQLQSFIEAADVLLDGVLGTGFKLPLKDDIGAALAAVQGIIAGMEWPPYIVAVDCPSGVDCDSGEAAAQTIPADATVTMAAVKQGLLKLPAYDLAGELRVVEIGRLDDLKSWQAIKNEVADADLIASLLPPRLTDAHKGTFGTALIAAGSVNYTGAALLAGKAAYRIGAGLVTLAIPTLLHSALAGQFPEATWVLLPHEMGVIASGAADVLLKNLERATALLIGPGMGLEDTSKEFIANLLGSASTRQAHGRMGFVKSQGDEPDQKSASLPPMVVDADGLKLLAKLPDWPKLLPAPAILTPHPGEMAVLTGLETEAIQKDRLNIAGKYAREWGHVVVLKGAFTVVAAPDGRTTTIPLATPALARAGTGDVLAGLIAGLRAQGVDAYDTARSAAWIHAQAGLTAAESVGSLASVLAGDVLSAVAYVLSELEK
ncbi:MAG TPA: NAD(P)H-hydrate dehydratase [Anaerolineales bacterium]|nr:NAD(P)H-hydrate dehydratase [Anaerolineales bacterium]